MTKPDFEQLEIIIRMVADSGISREKLKEALNRMLLQDLLEAAQDPLFCDVDRGLFRTSLGLYPKISAKGLRSLPRDFTSEEILEMKYFKDLSENINNFLKNQMILKTDYLIEIEHITRSGVSMNETKVLKELPECRFLTRESLIETAKKRLLNFNDFFGNLIQTIIDWEEGETVSFFPKRAPMKLLIPFV